MSNDERNLWQTLSETNVYENRWIKVEEHQVINPSGGRGIYGKVFYKNIAVGIIPVDRDGNTWLVGQWRYTLNQWSWEIPEGGAAPDVDILTSAKRELKEETGLTAAKWTMIQKTHLSNSVSDEVGYLYLAEDLTEGAHEREETEGDMKVKKVKVADAIQMMRDGIITDSLSVMALLHMSQRMK